MPAILLTQLVSGIAALFTLSLITYRSTDIWITISHKRGLLSIDLHKIRKIKAARIGGLPASLSIVISPTLISLIFSINTEILQLISIFYSMMGLIDDLVGMRNLEKIVISGLPFIFLYRWLSPFSPFTDISYALNIVAIILFGIYITNAFNTLAGFNGLEAGTSLIISLTLSIILVLRGDIASSFLMFTLAGILISFLTFNWIPAKAFPGNTLTFLLGGYISFISAIKGLYWPLIVLTIPHGTDFLLKIISWRKTEKKIPTRVREDETLIPPPNKSLAWLLINVGIKHEKKLVETILVIELALSFLTLLIYLPS